MKLVLVLYMAYSLNSVSAQTVVKNTFHFKPDTTNAECIKLFSQADTAFALHKDTILLSAMSAGFRFTQQKVLKELYGVNSAYSLLFIENCYNYHLKTLLNQKFGEDIITRTARIADSLDHASLGSLPEYSLIKPLWLNEYVRENLPKTEFAKLKMQLEKDLVYVGISIDSDGVCNVIGVTINDRPAKLPTLAKILDGKKLFSPKTIDGEKVSSEEWIRLNLD